MKKRKNDNLNINSKAKLRRLKASIAEQTNNKEDVMSMLNKFCDQSDDVSCDSDESSDESTDTDTSSNDSFDKISRKHSSGFYITQKMINEEKLNDIDTEWFYKNIKRMHELHGKERHELEDRMHRKYKMIVTLKTNNMYNKLNRLSDRDIIKEITTSNHSDATKSILINKMLSVTEESIEEYQKAINWMDTILSIPTSVKANSSNIGLTLNKLWEVLNEGTSEMKTVIIEIMQAVCTILTDPEHRGYILTLVGPPGVGKTSIGYLIANAIGMGFGHVSCGSIKDQSIIMGHSSTYIGSKPGLFTQLLINTQQLDNVILLDEMDKLSDQSMLPILLHVLDKSQNTRFNDAYCPEINIDLSRNMFIIAVNSIDKFDDALKDRLKIVKLDGYNIQQKVNICVNHIIPKITKKTGINVEISKQVIEKCIKSISPVKSGIREIERYFDAIFEKILLLQKSEIIRKQFKCSDNMILGNKITINKDLIDMLTT